MVVHDRTHENLVFQPIRQLLVFPVYFVSYRLFLQLARSHSKVLGTAEIQCFYKITL